MCVKTKIKIPVAGLIIGLVIVGGFFVFPNNIAKAATGINKEINFQGKVTNLDGTNVTNNSYNFLFCIYTTASPATPCTVGANNDAIWKESKSLTVSDGVFQTNLGDTATLPGTVDFNSDNIYLGINFNSNGQMSPLVQFTSSPYAFNADNLDGKDWANPGTIGTSASTLTLASNGISAWANTLGNLTISTVNSGTLNLTSAEALNLSAGTASTVTLANIANALNYDMNTLSIDALNNRIGIGTNAPSAYLDIRASDSNAASLQINPGTAPGTPNDGDLWYDGTNLYFRNNTENKNLLAGGTSTLQSSYAVASGNTIATIDAKDIAFTLSEVATPTKFSIENQDTAGTSAEYLKNSIGSGTLVNGLLVENTGAGTMTNAISILETAGTITTAISIGNNVGTGISIGTGVTTGISVGSGGITITSGGETINGGALAINNSAGITSNQATLAINATGTVDIQDILNSDSITTDTGGVAIASGQSYTGTGAVTLSSGTGTGLTIESGTGGSITIGGDGSAETINIGTGGAIKTLVIGSTNTSSITTIQSGSGGISLQTNGTASGNIQIGDGGSASATPDALVLDTGSAAPAGTNGAMYYSTALNKFQCYENGAWANCIGTGGSGGSPAGDDTQIQFNNAGLFGANAGLTFNNSTQTLGLNGTDAGIVMAGITNEPSAPATGSLEIYSKSIAGRMMPKWVGPSGLDSIVQPMVAMNKVAWWNPPGNATTAPGVLGMAAQTIVSNGGTALTSRSVATTNLFTRMKRAGIVTNTTAGYIASMRNGTAQFTVGNGSGLGGFTYVSRFGSTDTLTSSRSFVGMSSMTAVPTNVEPNTLTNSVGLCKLSTSNNWQICYGGSAAQTAIDLGANFPANTASTDMYELILFAPTNVNNAIGYRVTRLGTTYVASGTLTAATPGTQLPSATTLLAPRGWKTNNASASVVGLDFASIYIETDY